jgi:hypothetical protein
MRRVFSKPRWGAASLIECEVTRNVPGCDQRPSMSAPLTPFGEPIVVFFHDCSEVSADG